MDVIHCVSGIYEPKDVEVDLKEWDGSKVLEIELEPGPHYPRREKPSFDTNEESELTAGK